jgi:hypothetical protein
MRKQDNFHSLPQVARDEPGPSCRLLTFSVTFVYSMVYTDAFSRAGNLAAPQTLTSMVHFGVLRFLSAYRIHLQFAALECFDDAVAGESFLHPNILVHPAPPVEANPRVQ